MNLDSSPSPPDRPTISARHAGKLLRRDQRTVQRMIEKGDLEGGCQLINERRRWFVYSDQIGHREQSPAHPRDLTDAVAQLRTELAAARAREAAAQETNRLLLANQALMLNALNEYRQASDETAAIADEYRALTERHNASSAHYRQSADNFAQALANYRDIIGQALTPDDLRSIDDPTP